MKVQRLPSAVRPLTHDDGSPRRAQEPPLHHCRGPRGHDRLDEREALAGLS